MSTAPFTPPLLPEPLERGTLFSSAFPNVNISRMPGNQAEGAIAIDRADPSRPLAASNIDSGDGILVATSGDGGATWSRRIIANDSDNLPPACCDPSAAFDAFGNLFLAYVNAPGDAVVLLRSTDAGHSFTVLRQFKGDIDQPTVTTGPGGSGANGSVWLTFQRSNVIVVTGAADDGLGATGAFGPLEKIHGSGDGNFGDVAVGPAGQVMVTFQKQATSNRAKIYVAVDADGLGPGAFAKPVLATATRVADFDYIPAQNSRGIDAEAGLAYDRSGGAFDGRAYLVYTDETPASSGNTDVLLRYSDDGGVTWSAPIRVNDDATLNSQFNPRLALDQTTGRVGVGWYDARDDTGTGAGDADMLPNDDAGYYATVVTPEANGLLVSPNQKISAGVSDAYDASSDVDLGDYSGLDFHAGTLRPLWFDNSNSTGDNPDGSLMALDVYTATVPADTFAAGATIALGGLPPGAGAKGAPGAAGPVASLYIHGTANPGYVKRGSRYAVTVQYFDPAGVNGASLGDDLLVTGPNQFRALGQVAREKALKDGSVLATYEVTDPVGKWSAAQDGAYQIELEPGRVLDAAGRSASGGILGNFFVTVSRGNGSHGGGTGPRHHPRATGDGH